MNKKLPLKSIVNSVSNEKGISKEIIFAAIKEAILYATKKKYKMLNIETHLDQETGIYKTYALYNVTTDIKNLNPFKDITLVQAKKYNPEIKIGESIKKEIESISFGRIDAQLAKQIIIKKVKTAEKELTFKELNKNQTKLFNGIIKKETQSEIIITIDNNTTGIIKKNDLLPNDIFKVGDTIKACLIDILSNGTDLKLSRVCDDMIRELMKIEIPEIKTGLIEIKAIARDPGIKTKIAIKTNIKNIDPLGACIGLRGTRIQNISKELCGEKIEIIKWDNDIFKYIINIFNPIEIKSIEMDETIKTLNISIEQKNFPKILGKHGKNIKLITKLIKWNLNINDHLKKSKKYD